jgi:hypothetical protein
MEERESENETDKIKNCIKSVVTKSRMKKVKRDREM